MFCFDISAQPLLTKGSWGFLESFKAFNDMKKQNKMGRPTKHQFVFERNVEQKKGGICL